MTRWQKRKHDDIEDEEEGDDVQVGPSGQVLPVARSLQADGIPRDGAEYLLTVRMDAERLPRFTKVLNPYLTSSHPPPPFVGPPKERRHPALPSDEWKETFRKRMEILRSNAENAIPSPSDIEYARSQRLPGPKDRPGWQLFLFGSIPTIPIVPPAPSPSVIVSQSQSPVATAPAAARPDNDEEEEGEVADEEFLDTQPVDMDFDVDDASTSDEEGGGDGGDVSKDRLPSASDEPGESARQDEPAVVEPPIESPQKGPSTSRPNASLTSAPTTKRTACQPTVAVMQRLDQVTIGQILLFYEFWIRKSLEYISDPESGEYFSMLMTPLPVPPSALAAEASISSRAKESPSSSSVNAEPSTSTAKPSSASPADSSPKGTKYSNSPSSTTNAVIDPYHLKWLFALLVTFHNDLVDAKEVSNLRSLARAVLEVICLSLERSTSPTAVNQRGSDDGDREKDKERAGLWMIVGAIVTVWGQADLWDEANERLLQSEVL